MSLTLAMAAGCGDAPAPEERAPAAPQVAACELFTQSDAQAVLGEEVNWMSSVLAEAKGGDPVHCAYNAGSDTTRTLSLEVRRSDSAEKARRNFDAARSLLTGSEPVAGIGEAAFWLGRGVDQLHVHSGNVHLIVTAHPGPQRDAQAAARTVAGRALARLKSAS